MELSQKFYGDFMGKRDIQAFENKITVHYKNLLDESKVEFNYNELSSNIVRGKHGEEGWTALGWILGCIFIALAISFDIMNNSSIHSGSGRSVYLWIMKVLPLLTVFIFSLRLVKYEYVAFYIKNSDKYAFHIKVSGQYHESGEKMVAYISEKIKQAHLSNKS